MAMSLVRAVSRRSALDSCADRASSVARARVLSISATDASVGRASPTRRLLQQIQRSQIPRAGLREEPTGGSGVGRRRRPTAATDGGGDGGDGRRCDPVSSPNVKGRGASPATPWYVPTIVAFG